MGVLAHEVQPAELRLERSGLFQESRVACQSMASIAHHCWNGNSGGSKRVKHHEMTNDPKVLKLQLQTSHGGKGTKEKRAPLASLENGVSHASTARRTKCTHSCLFIQYRWRFSQDLRVLIADAISHEGVHVLGQRSLVQVVNVGRHIVWRAVVARIPFYHLAVVKLIALIIQVPDTSPWSMVCRPSNCASVVRMVVGFWTCTSNHVLGLYEECPQSSYLAYVAHLVPVHARTLLVFLPEAIF